jgi:hypothetical protein
MLHAALHLIPLDSRNNESGEPGNPSLATPTSTTHENPRARTASPRVVHPGMLGPKLHITKSKHEPPVTPSDRGFVQAGSPCKRAVPLSSGPYIIGTSHTCDIDASRACLGGPAPTLPPPPPVLTPPTSMPLGARSSTVKSSGGGGPW